MANTIKKSRRKPAPKARSSKPATSVAPPVPTRLVQPTLALPHGARSKKLKQWKGYTQYRFLDRQPDGSTTILYYDFWSRPHPTQRRYPLRETRERKAYKWRHCRDMEPEWEAGPTGPQLKKKPPPPWIYQKVENKSTERYEDFFTPSPTEPASSTILPPPPPPAPAAPMATTPPPATPPPPPLQPQQMPSPESTQSLKPNKRTSKKKCSPAETTVKGSRVSKRQKKKS